MYSTNAQTEEHKYQVLRWMKLSKSRFHKIGCFGYLMKKHIREKIFIQKL